MSKVGCADCGRSYGEPGFPDLCIPDYAWDAISPSGGHGGLLCPSCICARLEKVGLENVPGYWGSGPLRFKPASELKHASASLRRWRDLYCDALKRIHNLEEQLKVLGYTDE